MYTKEDLKKAYNAGASNQEMQDAGLESMVAFNDWYLWAYHKAKNLPISNISGLSKQFNCFLEDSEQGERCESKCKDCKQYRGLRNYIA